MNNSKERGFKTAKKNKKKSVIDRKGMFTIRIGSEILDVMFYNDYKRAYEVTDYAFAQGEKNGIKKRFKIGNRSRSSTVVLMNGELTDLLELKCDNIADKDGFFSLVLNGRARKAIFVSDYAKIHGLSKPAVTKRAQSPKSRIELVYIKTATTTIAITIVLLKEPKRQTATQAND